MCIWYKCSILFMIFIFWSFHGYYIRKEKNLCFSGVCQPNQKLFIDYLPVWGNSNLIFSQCPWCISSYGCCLLWTQCGRYLRYIHSGSFYKIFGSDHAIFCFITGRWAHCQGPFTSIPIREARSQWSIAVQGKIPISIRSPGSLKSIIKF